jgi:putative ABC transport system permease protein
MNKMIFSNLAYRPLRSIISIFAVAIEVTLILLIVGFALGTLNDTRVRTKGVGADIMVRPPGSSIFAALSAAPMPIKSGGRSPRRGPDQQQARGSQRNRPAGI